MSYKVIFKLLLCETIRTGSGNKGMNTGIPKIYCVFPGRPLRKIEYHNKVIIFLLVDSLAFNFVKDAAQYREV